MGDTYRVIASGEQTGGAYAVIDMLVPPGGGPAPMPTLKFRRHSTSWMGK
ncbi:MAG: hypothetical protein WKG07_31590 [Hymenobacter sp.]